MESLIIYILQHQDGGIYSVNIALNSHKSDFNEKGFTGGGTFFEALADDKNLSSVQRPVSPGHAIFHKTTERHAGVSCVLVYQVSLLE